LKKYSDALSGKIWLPPNVPLKFSRLVLAKYFYLVAGYYLAGVSYSVILFFFETELDGW
jgi:hypothetical protein